MDKLDLTQPVEAAHRFSRAVCSVTIRFSGDECIYLDEQLPGDWGTFRHDGTHVNSDCPWYLRNTAKPSTPSNEELTEGVQIMPDVVADMIALMREMVGPPIAQGNTVGKAANILKRIDLPKPVDPIDPDLIEARECVARVYEGARRLDLAILTRAGQQDNRLRVQSARLAIARGRTLAAGGTAHE